MLPWPIKLVQLSPEQDRLSFTLSHMNYKNNWYRNLLDVKIYKCIIEKCIRF